MRAIMSEYCASSSWNAARHHPGILRAITSESAPEPRGVDGVVHAATARALPSSAS
jgi:hypothetical protein